MRIKGLRRDLAIVLGLLLLSLLFFWPVTLGGKTLLPADNAFAWEPWRSYAQEAGVSVPHNGLLSDLYLENYVWKRFIVQSLHDRELPLWNPAILSGAPFLAAGQHSAMYPFSVLFYVLPLPAAYGWFAALHLFLAGLSTYLLARTLHLRRGASAISAVTFAFCGFVVVSNVFPMIIAALVWLPLVLAVIERTARRASRGERALVAYIPESALGVVALGMVLLAGHPEMYYYVGLTCAAFAAWRLWTVQRGTRSCGATALAAAVLAGVALVGVGLGAAQWLPLLDLVQQNFREGGASFREILGWAFPLRRVISLLIPDFYGNPAHHSYFDLLSWRVVPATVNALGQSIDTIYWGIKNYVEGASYVGTLPVLLALMAVVRAKWRQTGFWLVLALLSLLFVFGSPLYYVVFKLPGLSQVHSPFRWVYPYSLCLAILAGYGAEALLAAGRGHTEQSGWRARWERCRRWLATVLVPRLSLLVGALLLGGLAASLMAKERVADLAGRVMLHLALAPEAFADGGMFYSYQFRNLLILGAALFLGGLLLVLRRRFPRPAYWLGAAALVIVAELFVIGTPFFPAVDPALVAYRTPGIDFLTNDPDLFRITSFVGGSEKTLNANTASFYDLQDVRGYDSIIPRQYAQMMALIDEQRELPYNRIAPIFHEQALEAPLLDMLNVKYVVTDRARTLDAGGYELVYDGEMRIYRNNEALPRAFLVAQAVSISDQEQRAQALRTFDPRQVVILEETIEPLGPPPAGFDGRVEAIDYGANEVEVHINPSAPCYLVLGDSFFADWLAFTRPPEAPDPSQAEIKLHIYRANGNFRAVRVEAGPQIIRFKYSPNAVKFGLYLSFLAGVMVALALGLWLWLRYHKEPGGEETVQRVTKNTVAPIMLNLINKIIDMAFAMLMLRILGDADAGYYYLAIVIVSWFDIFTNFGLNTLLTREVARDREHANRYLLNTMISRVGLWALSVPVLGLFFLARQLTLPLNGRTILAICLFLLGLLPSNMSQSFAAVFNAYERMELPASVTTLTTLLKVTLGTLALFVAGGFVGLAAVSIVVNLITMVILYLLLRRKLFRPHFEFDWQFQRAMLRESYPLMINLLMATLFFKVAVLLLEWILKDARVVGWYSVAYKYIDAVQLIPAYFTMAIFPMMSRYAAESQESLVKAYRLAVKLLVIVAVPLSMVGWALSREMITVLGGPQYLPYAASVLKVMIWYMPLGFINSVTQYVLIALNQQRFLTRAFAIGLAFSLAANVIGISQFGYMASAYLAIASELVLMIPFCLGIWRHLAHMSWLKLVWKQAVSAVPMALLFIGFHGSHRLLSLVGGLAIYCLGLSLLRVFNQGERAAVAQALPLKQVSGKPKDLAPTPQS